MIRPLLLAAAFALAAPAQAQDTRTYYTARIAAREVPQQLSQEEREYYDRIFTAIDRQRWSEVQTLLAEKADGLLHPVARAEYYVAAGSPRVELAALETWLATGRDLPQAAQLSRLAQTRGRTAPPDLPYVRDTRPQPTVPRRIRPASIEDGTMPGGVDSAILRRITEDDPDGALALLRGVESALSREALAEWIARVSWSYFIENRDADALTLASRASEGAGPWVAEGEWTAGLAAWRLGDCAGAGAAFQRSASQAFNPTLRTAALYWAARAAMRCRQPASASALFAEAAGNDDTLYGMLAAEQLGRNLPERVENADFSDADWHSVGGYSNVRVAVALTEIGRDVLASEVLQHQARIGDPREYEALTRLARSLGFPRTQIAMAMNAPPGARAHPSAFFPAPKWQPESGWQIDPALAFAHILQESVFRADAVSPANAQGLMQITPITVRQHAPCIGRPAGAINTFDPGTNLALGQCNLQMLRNDPQLSGQLPKIMAAYNAGQSPVRRWEEEINDSDDPLLWMEAVPYWETRSYVAIVMTNYWMYERQAGTTFSTSRRALAQNAWPPFPGDPPITGGQ